MQITVDEIHMSDLSLLRSNSQRGNMLSFLRTYVFNFMIFTFSLKGMESWGILLNVWVKSSGVTTQVKAPEQCFDAVFFLQNFSIFCHIAVWHHQERIKWPLMLVNLITNVELSRASSKARRRMFGTNEYFAQEHSFEWCVSLKEKFHKQKNSGRSTALNESTDYYQIAAMRLLN